jgi:hypothetical protein
MCGCNCKSGKLGMPCRNRVNGNSAVDMSRPAPDTMRHGGFNYEVVGSDRAATGTARESSPMVARTATNPSTNQAGALAPNTSARGQVLHAAAGGIFIREMNPIMQVKGFGNNVGINRARSARNISVVAGSGYDGILPLTQQPRINKPLPY